MAAETTGAAIPAGWRDTARRAARHGPDPLAWNAEIGVFLIDGRKLSRRRGTTLSPLAWAWLQVLASGGLLMAAGLIAARVAA